MKKILNEWRKFLKENKDDDTNVAQRIVAAIAPMSLSTKETNDFLRINKKRAARIIRDFLYSDNVASPISLNPPKDLVKVAGAQYEFPSKDFEGRMIAALDIFEDPNVAFDFSAFNQKDGLSDNPKPGIYGRKEHSGGAGEAGLALPNEAFEEEPRTALDPNIKRWARFHKALWSGDLKRINQAKSDVVPALEYFSYLYQRYMPTDEKYAQKLKMLADEIRTSDLEVPQEPTKSDYQLAREELESLKKMVEDLTLLARKTPKSPDEKRQVDQAKMDLPSKSKQYRDFKRKVRGMRER